METQVDRIMKNLRCSREEAEAILAEDKRIDRGEKVDFDLTDEQHKQAMKNANAGTRTAKESKTARNAAESFTNWCEEQYGFTPHFLLTNAVASHMGQWSTDREDRPFTSVDRCVHMADYMASRSFIDIPAISEDYNRVVEENLPL